MSDIHILRAHDFGFEQARKLATKWAEEAEKRFDMECTVIEGKTCDTVEFKRSGVTGSVRVTADQFELSAKLGFLLAGFSKTIEAEIEKNLDALLARAGKSVAKK